MGGGKHGDEYMEINRDKAALVEPFTQNSLGQQLYHSRLIMFNHQWYLCKLALALHVKALGKNNHTTQSEEEIALAVPVRPG